MKHISGISRQQLQIISLEDKISLDNPIRFIEAFVDNISLEKLGFIAKTIKSEGRPSFDIKVFLKIYLYGYLNGIRSSRKLEKECIRNIELQLIRLEKVNGEHSLIMLVYNIKRSIKILGVPDLIAKIKSWNAKYPTNGFVFIKTAYLKLKLDLIDSQTPFAA